MRGSRFLLLVVLAAAVPSGVLPVDGAVAQELPPVVIRLRSQSAWNNASRPLLLSFAATNTSDQPLEDLSVVLSIGTPTLSRSAFERSLQADQTAFPFALPFSFQGQIEPGGTRTFQIRHRFTTYPQPSQSGLYPIKVQLLSGNLTRATLRTAMVFLVETPEVPLSLAWTWVLESPLQRTPDGRFRAGPLPGALAEGGRIDAMVGALDAVTPLPVDVVVSPVLAGQLEAMAGGYRIEGASGEVQAGTNGSADAGRVLATLRRVVARAGVELVAQPVGDARPSSLIRSGLGGDVGRLLEAGRNQLAEILGTEPTPTVFRPPLSQVDPAAAAALSSHGVETLLLDPGAVPPDADLPFGPPAGSARPLVVVAQDPTLYAITPDPGVGAVAALFPDDPRLAAQAALAELAAVWLEFPGTAGRGLSVVLSERAMGQPAFVHAFGRLVSRSPWLLPARATDLVAGAEQPPTGTIPPRSHRALNRGHVQQLLDARRAVVQFDQAVDGGADLVARLEANLLLAEGDVALSNPDLARLYTSSVQRTIEATYRQVRPPPSGSRFTLTSKGEAPPLTVSNDSRFPLRVVVRVVSSRRLLFPSGNTREVTLDPKRVTLVRVPVRAVATGRFPVKVQILTGGTGERALIAESDLVIRSTAYNRIALLLTIGAAVFLLAWWGRGVLQHRRRRIAAPAGPGA